MCDKDVWLGNGMKKTVSPLFLFLQKSGGKGKARDQNDLHRHREMVNNHKPGILLNDFAATNQNR